MAIKTTGFNQQNPPPAKREHYERLAVELVRALRGRRSRAALSRRAGYRSNIVQRWEAATCWPTAARFIQIHQHLRPRQDSWLQRFYKTDPAWAVGVDAAARGGVAAFMRQLQGNTPIVEVARSLARSRFTVARWLDGSAEPKLPEFLEFVDVVSRRLLDLVAAFEDPGRLPSVRDAWAQLELARKAAYELPWSHGVLHALELSGAPRGVTAQQAWLARQLSISPERVQEALAVLEATGQVRKRRNGYQLSTQTPAVNTNEAPDKARGLKEAWLRTALERLQSGTSGRFGYSVFAVSRNDLARIHQLHLSFVRSVQQLIANSEPNECVGLYCSQLVNLGGEFPAGCDTAKNV